MERQAEEKFEKLTKIHLDLLNSGGSKQTHFTRMDLSGDTINGQFNHVQKPYTNG